MSISSDFFGGLSGAVAVLPQTIGLDASAGAMAGLMRAIILLLSSGISGDEIISLK